MSFQTSPLLLGTKELKTMLLAFFTFCLGASADQKLKVAEVLLDREMAAADRRCPNNQVPLKYHLATRSEPDAEKH